MKIVVSGSIAYDYLMTFPGRFTDQIIPEKLTRLSVSFLVDDMVRQRGGTAANIAYSLKLLGGDPILFGTVGQDFGDYATWLRQHGSAPITSSKYQTNSLPVFLSAQTKSKTRSPISIPAP